MASDQQQQQKFPGWAIALIIVSILAVVGVLAFVLFGPKMSANVGAPVPNIAPPAVPSMTNVSSGNMGAGAGANVARTNLKI
jgi:hypothetical protein